MTFTNESLFDRSVRILLGISFAILAWIAWPGVAAAFAAVIATVALVTGVVGWCPAYTLFGFSTEKRRV
jgi:hypothetical protein